MNYWYLLLFLLVSNHIKSNDKDSLQNGLSLLEIAKKVHKSNLHDAQILYLCALNEFIEAQSAKRITETIKLYGKLQKREKIGKKDPKRLIRKKLITSLQKKACTTIQTADSPLFVVLDFCRQLNKHYNFQLAPPSEMCQLSIRLLESEV